MTMPGRNFSVCQPLTDPREDADRLYELMKTAASDDKNAPGDTDESTVGVNPDTYEDPPDQEEDNVEALWGSEDRTPGDPSGTNQHHTNAAWDGFKASREKFLKKTFGSFDASAKNSQDVLSQNLNHFKSGDHESSKPFTNDHSKRNPTVLETTLGKTKRLLGRT